MEAIRSSEVWHVLPTIEPVIRCNRENPMIKNMISYILGLSVINLLSCVQISESKSKIKIQSDSASIEHVDLVETKKLENEQYPLSFSYSDSIKALELEYIDILKPILDLKGSDSAVYSFIVSSLKTNSGTPSWKGYGETGLNKKAIQRGIDCSGFARIMQDQIFHYQIRGSSRGIPNKYCNKINFENRAMGDLLFFKAPNANNERIVHVGVFLKNKFFVHATSTRSAAQGFGLRIDSLDNKRWDGEMVAIGRVKNKYRILDSK